ISERLGPTLCVGTARSAAAMRKATTQSVGNLCSHAERGNKNDMKYAIVIPDGCADEPQDSLGGRTPLQAANTPAMDEIARLGVVGRANNVPAHLPAGSDVANLSLFGYDPNKYFTG